MRVLLLLLLLDEAGQELKQLQHVFPQRLKSRVGAKGLELCVCVCVCVYKYLCKYT